MTAAAALPRGGARECTAREAKPTTDVTHASQQSGTLQMPMKYVFGSQFDLFTTLHCLVLFDSEICEGSAQSLPQVQRRWSSTQWGLCTNSPRLEISCQS